MSGRAALRSELKKKKRKTKKKERSDDPPQPTLIDQPANLLDKSPKIPDIKTIGKSSETRTAEATVVIRRADLEKRLKLNAVDASTVMQDESDSDLESDKRISTKATGALLRRKASRARAFIGTQNNPNKFATQPVSTTDATAITEAYTVAERTIAQTRQLAAEMQAEKYAKLYNSKPILKQTPPQVQVSIKKEMAQQRPMPNLEDGDQRPKRVIEEDDDMIIALPAPKRVPKQETTQTQTDTENGSDGRVIALKEFTQRGGEQTKLVPISEIAKKPKPLIEFFKAIETESGPDGKLTSEPLVINYYGINRLYASIYRTIKTGYDLVLNQTKKRNKVGQEDSMMETLTQIENKQHYPIFMSRRYEQSIMRTVRPNSHERPCLNGTECEFFFMLGRVKQIGVECLSPKDNLEFQKTGRLPQKLETCILCKRRAVTIHFMNARSMCGDMTKKMLFQTHYNHVEVDGEYCLANCIMSSTTEFQCIFLPVVLHERTLYRQVETEPGVWTYMQYGYPKPEEVRGKRRDFC